MPKRVCNLLRQCFAFKMSSHQKTHNKNKHDPAKWDTIDAQIEQLLCEHDENSVPVPDIEFEPHLLISKVSTLPILLPTLKKADFFKVIETIYLWFYLK